MQRLKLLFENHLASEVDYLGKGGRLKEACMYSLLNGGKRVRPLIVLMMGEGRGAVPNLNAALAVELFHTASLIADDLPCMDDDDFRRDVPTLHKAYDETTAVLASYGLLCAAFEMIERASQLGDEKRALMALKSAAVLSGLMGTTGGQYLDLFADGLEWTVLKEVIEKKTIALFEVTFVFGWLFSSGEIERLDEVKELAYHFGMAFQVGDDLIDYEKDLKQSNPMNAAICLGYDTAALLYREEMERCKKSLAALSLMTPQFEELLCLIEKKVFASIKA